MSQDIRGGGRRLLAVAHVLEVILPAARLVLYARLMPSDEFGLAIALTLVFSAAELITDFGLQQSILRADSRDRARLGSYHSLALLRALLVGFALILLAPIHAWLFARPEAWLAFAVPGVVFALRGAVNLGIKQAARDFQFGPDAITMIASQLVWTAVAWLAAIWLGNHLVVLIGIAAAVLTQIVVSQFLSPAPFQLRWDRETVREAWRFGYPLLPNGAALAVASLGDRFIIGALQGVRALALYTPLVTLAMMPRGNVLRYANSVLLPTFIAHAEAGRPLGGLLHMWSRLLSLLGLALGLGILALGPAVIAVLFGPTYAPPHDLTVMVALLIYVRMLLGLPVPAALATGQTGLVTLGSLATAASLVPAAAALWWSGHLALFVLTMAIFESVSFVVIAQRVRRTYEAKIRRMSVEWLLGASLLMALAVAEWIYPMSVPVRVGLAAALGLLGFAALRGDQLLKIVLKRKSHPSGSEEKG